MKLRYVHKAILSADHISDVINKLNVTASALNQYLQCLKDPETQKPPTFDDLKYKWVNEEVGKTHWGEQYDTLVTRLIKNPEELEFHTIFNLLADYDQNINSISALACRLSTTHESINKFLSRFSIAHFGKNVLLDFKLLKEHLNDVHLFKEALGVHYDECVERQKNIKARAFNIEIRGHETNKKQNNNNTNQPKEYSKKQYTIKTIHQAILDSDSVQTAEKKLHFATNTLNRFLEQFYITKNRTLIPLSFEGIKQYFPTPEDGIKHFKEHHYNKPMRPYPILFDERPIYEIHRIISSSANLAEAASRLNLTTEELQNELNHLVFYSHEGISSGFDKIKKITQDEVFNIWGLNYYFPIRSMTDGFQMTPHRIHQAIINSSDINEAEDKLSIPQGTLAQFLCRCYSFEPINHVHLSLSYDRIKIYFPTEESAKKYFHINYDKVLLANPVPFSNRTFYEIHRIIVNSNNLDEAAAELNISSVEFEQQLSRIGNNYSFATIKETWPDILSGMDAWKSAYYQTIASLQNSFTQSQWPESSQTRNSGAYSELRNSPTLFKRKRDQEMGDNSERELKRRKKDGPNASGAVGMSAAEPISLSSDDESADECSSIKKKL